MKSLLDFSQPPVFEILWKWTVLLVLGWTAHALLRSRDARWRLILWRGVFCFGLALPLIQFLPLPVFQIPVHDIARIAPATAGVTAPSLAGGAIPSGTARPVAPVVVAAAKDGAAVDGVHCPAGSLFSTISLNGMLISIWAVGALCGALRLVRFMIQLSTLKRAAIPAAPAIQGLAGEILQRLRIRHFARVLVSDSAVSPFVFGVTHPAIMLPGKLVQNLSSEEMAALLGHEIAHLRRHDLLWCAGWRWMKALFWFHPLVWKVPEAHSLACEEEADRVASSQIENRASYARILARITLRVLAIPEMETQLTANGAAHITQRLRRLGKESETWKQKHSLAAFGLVLAMILVSAGCNVTGEKDTQEVKQLKAQVAALEKRISEMENSLPPEARQRAYHERFDRRRELDRKKYTEEQLAEAEKMYLVANRKWGSPEAIESLKQMIEKFPDINRTGCAVLYLAQTTTGPESEKYLKDCIQKYNDCYYGDGVQVGAYARFLLADYYSITNENEKAEALCKEIKDNYSDSIDHHGQLLINLMPGKPQAEQQARQRAYRERFDRRRELDRKKYTDEQLTEAEEMMATADRQFGSAACIETLKQMVEKFPNANRAGCALLYLAQSTTGPESEKHFMDCIQKYDDCYYGDGVRVGAFARFLLADYYSKTGENEKAEALYKEIKDNYSDAIDHNGQLLINLIK
jgi:beta-lactamase regulating signal transducer with metallopeptidase domain